MRPKLRFLPIEKLLEEFRSKRASPRDLWKELKLVQDTHNAFIRCCYDELETQITEAERRYATHTPRVLEGVPIGIKDNIITIIPGVKNLATTAGSRMLEKFIAPPEAEATVVRKLKKAGAILVGKTNLDEFAVGSSNCNSAFGPVKNAWSSNIPYSPGGSSGGSATAVALGMCSGAVGTDTGGSITLPACYSGIVGIKPTCGVCSRVGLMPQGSILDQPGPMATTAVGCGMLLKVMQGKDDRDATSVDHSLELEGITAPIHGIKVAIAPRIVQEYCDTTVARSMEKAYEYIQNIGTLHEVDIRGFQYLPQAYYVLSSSAFASNMARFDGIRYGSTIPKDHYQDTYKTTREYGFCKETVRRIYMGCLSIRYKEGVLIKKAIQLRSDLEEQLRKILQKYDILCLPGAPRKAPTIEMVQKGIHTDPLMAFREDTMTIMARIVGYPVISLVVGQDENGICMGIQLVAKPFQEAKLLRIAHNLEQHGMSFYNLEKKKI